MNEQLVSWWSTALFALTALGALPLTALRGVAAIVAILMFFAGIALMATALVMSLGRRRPVVIGALETCFVGPHPLLFHLCLQGVAVLCPAGALPPPARVLFAPGSRRCPGARRARAAGHAARAAP